MVSWEGKIFAFQFYTNNLFWMGGVCVEQKVLFRAGSFPGFIQGWGTQHSDFIFKFLTFVKGMRRLGELKIFLCDPRDRKILLISSPSC